MIDYNDSNQRTIAEFDWPFHSALDAHNLWVKLGQCIPWDGLAQGYHKSLSSKRGRPAKDARLVIGAVIIKHKLGLSDRETVSQIKRIRTYNTLSGLSVIKDQLRLYPRCWLKYANVWGIWLLPRKRYR